MKNKDLTQGKPFKTLLIFSLPMLISVTLQQFYNICDSLIGGNMIKDSGNSLSAINATYPITMIFLAIATGFGIGVNIVIARYVGEKNLRSVKEGIYTALIFSFLVAVGLIIITFFFTELMLKAINVSDSYFNKAAIYLKWYILGLAFLIIYNVVNNSFQALGKSNIPLYFLIFSTALNILLDILFVNLIEDVDLKIRGIAVATFISQGLASFLSFLVLLIFIKKTNKERINVLFNKNILMKILPIAIPSIIQASIISFGQILIQSKVNSLDINYPGAVAGYGSSYKICYVIVNIYTMMSNAISTYTSQNAGAKKYDRIIKGFKAGLSLCLILTIITTTIFLIMPEQLLSIFASNKDNKEYFIYTGKKFIYYVAPFFILLCIKIPCDGVLKGSKDMRSFMIATFADLIVRVGLTYILEPFYGMDGIFISWPIGWLVGMSLSLIFYFRGRWKRLIGYELNIQKI